MKMDNETPKYAEWIPEAGGYVSNGKVVSKSPQYDEGGKLRLNVDTSVFGGTQPASPVVKAQPQVANTATTNNGITTANVAGSGADANATATSIGSAASLNLNTANPNESVLSTPATKNPLITMKPQNVVDEINQGYLDAAARNDYKAEIDWLTKASNYDGLDRTAEINDLWRQRGEKIRAQDFAYSQGIKEARAAGDYARASQLSQEQQQYRDSVGYQDQMAREYQIAQDDLKTTYDEKRQDIIDRYNSDWLKGIQTITNSILQLVGDIQNFQYNPATDPALNIAQGYAVAKIKEHAAATGMYNSSMTQRAIAKAVTELVPVYQKMAKDELITNLNMLQSTASYLMDLDKYQFDMWRTQIQMQWQANEEKQKEVERAIANSNARGYVTNEEAAILGVPAGSLSFQAIQKAEEKQEKLEEEQRSLQQKKELEEFKYGLDIEKYKEQSKVDLDEYKEKAKVDYYYSKQLYKDKLIMDDQYAPKTKKGSLTHAELKALLKSMALAGASEDDLKATALDYAETSADAYSAYNQAIFEANQEIDKREQERVKAEEDEYLKYTNLPTEAKTDIKSRIVKTELNDLLGDNWSENKFTHTVNGWVANKSISDGDIKNALDAVVTSKLKDTLTTEAGRYGEDYKETTAALETVIDEANKYADLIYGTKFKDREAVIDTIYEDVIHDIKFSKRFDTTWGDIFSPAQVDQNKGVDEVLKSIKNNTEWGGADSHIYQHAKAFADNGGIRESDTTDLTDFKNVIAEGLMISETEEYLDALERTGKADPVGVARARKNLQKARETNQEKAKNLDLSNL